MVVDLAEAEEPEDLENHLDLKEALTLLHQKLEDLQYLFLHKVTLFQLEGVALTQVLVQSHLLAEALAEVQLHLLFHHQEALEDPVAVLIDNHHQTQELEILHQ